MSNIPCSERQIKIQQPVFVTRYEVVISFDTVKTLVAEYLKDKLIGPKEIKLPEQFDVEPGIDEPDSLVVTFDIP